MGQTKEYIVKGAMAQCNQSKVPMIAQLQLIPDNLFVNVNGNLVVTDKSLGPVFGPVPFGVCNMIPPTPAVPTPPCACVILSWSGAYTSEKINQIASPLVKDSKGTCALGGSISFKTTGQFPKPSIPAVQVPSVGAMNPLSDEVVGKMKSSVKNEGNPLFSHFNGDMTTVNMLCEQLNAANLEYRMVEIDGGVAIAVLGEKGGTLETVAQIGARETDKMPTSYGYWDGEPGNSVFHSKPDEKGCRFPKNESLRKEWGLSASETPDHKGTGIIGDVEKMMNDHLERNGEEPNYTFKGVPFENGKVNFDDCCFGQVTVETYSLDRDVNFQLAEEMMAKQLNETKGPYIDPKTGKKRDYTAADVRKWMKDDEHRMTWHECQDGRTIQKVPTILHNNVDHTGGVSKEKLAMNKAFGLTEIPAQDYNNMIAWSAKDQELIQSQGSSYVAQRLDKESGVDPTTYMTNAGVGKINENDLFC